MEACGQVLRLQHFLVPSHDNLGYCLINRQEWKRPKNKSFPLNSARQSPHELIWLEYTIYHSTGWQLKVWNLAIKRSLCSGLHTEVHAQLEEWHISELQALTGKCAWVGHYREKTDRPITFWVRALTRVIAKLKTIMPGEYCQSSKGRPMLINCKFYYQIPAEHSGTRRPRDITMEMGKTKGLYLDISAPPSCDWDDFEHQGYFKLSEPQIPF